VSRALCREDGAATGRYMIDWVLPTLASAFLLGCCELFMKQAVRENAVLPVLMLLALCNAGIWAALLAWQTLAPGMLPEALLVAPLSARQHGEIALKSVFVGASWICSYFAVKHLPVTIASPIRATSPIWTVLGALALLREHPTALQLAGVAVTFVGVFALSWAGRLEGILFRRDRWVALMFISAVLGAASVLYDKHLFTTAGFAASTVQAWFYFYLAPIFVGAGVVSRIGRREGVAFQWRWSIPLISVTLLLGDFVYFETLRDRDALIVLVAAVRRTSTLVAFLGAWWIFREVNGRQKLPAVIAVLLGIVLTAVG
jgi:bacterial/archaeal transporter family protein